MSTQLSTQLSSQLSARLSAQLSTRLSARLFARLSTQLSALCPVIHPDIHPVIWCFPIWLTTSLTDSSRGLKSVCKFKICKNFAKILHRRNLFAIFLQIFCDFFSIFFQFFSNFFSNFLHIFQKKKRTSGHESIIQQPLIEKRILTWKWVPFVLIPNQFAKIFQKNFKKFKKKIQKSCKKIAKILQKVVVKNLQNFCRFFAEFLQLHILQKVLHFRPREESVSYPMATSVWMKFGHFFTQYDIESLICCIFF